MFSHVHEANIPAVIEKTVHHLDPQLLAFSRTFNKLYYSVTMFHLTADDED